MPLIRIRVDVRRSADPRDTASPCPGVPPGGVHDQVELKRLSGFHVRQSADVISGLIVVDGGQVGQLDITKEGKIDVQFAQQLRQQLRLVGIEPGWDLPGLANWLDRQMLHPDISLSESRLFLLRSLERLQEKRKLTTEQLAQQKYRLRESLAAKIDHHRHSHRHQAFQTLLFESAEVIVNDTPQFCFHFQERNYAPNWYYEGSYRFHKHFFPVVGELKSRGRRI